MSEPTGRFIVSKAGPSDCVKVKLRCDPPYNVNGDELVMEINKAWLPQLVKDLTKHIEFHKMREERFKR